MTEYPYFLKGIKDISSYPVIINELLRRDYSEKDLEKMCSGNIFRVWNEVEEYSQRMKLK